MKPFLLLIVLSLSAIGQQVEDNSSAASGPIYNVKWGFGAKGDGTTDDAPAIQAAFVSAKAANGTVLFPPGTYLLSTFHHPADASAMVGLSDYGSSWTVNVRCDGATLTTAQTGASNMSLVELDGGWSNSLISGCKFLNTHGLTPNWTSHLNIQGGGGQLAAHNRIENCTFADASRQIVLSGVTDIVLAKNTYLLNGRDHGTGSSTDPNVAIWAFDNSPNGYSSNVKIIDSQYDGCSSGTLANSTNSTCGDGMIYGMYRDLIATANNVKHFSQEGIFVEADNVAGTLYESGNIVVGHNSIDATMVPGDAVGGGNYAIRVDQSHSLISANSIVSAKIGIWCYRPDYGATGLDLNVMDNTIVMAQGPQTSSNGIGIIGMSDISVLSNTISGAAPATVSGGQLTGIYITGLNGTTAYADRVQVSLNRQYVAVPPAGGWLGLWVQWTATGEFSRNQFNNLTTCAKFQNLSAMTPARSLLFADNKENCATPMTYSGSTPADVVHVVTASGILPISTFATLPLSPNPGQELFCTDCKNASDDTTGTFDSNAASGGHGTKVIFENGFWRVH